jgi:hypothetical protein
MGEGAGHHLDLPNEGVDVYGEDLIAPPAARALSAIIVANFVHGASQIFLPHLVEGVDDGADHKLLSQAPEALAVRLKKLPANPADLPSHCGDDRGLGVRGTDTH